MGVDTKDPFLKRVLRAKNKRTAEALLSTIIDEETEKYRASLHDILVKQFGINAAYFGKRAVDKVWEWFAPPMDFSAQPAVMQGSTVTMAVGLGQEKANGKVQKKTSRGRSRAVVPGKNRRRRNLA